MTKNLNENTHQAALYFANEVESQAHALAPVHTGALQESIYTTTQMFGVWQYGARSSFASVTARVKAKNPGVTTIEQSTPTGKVLARVVACTDYAKYVEFGTRAHGPVTAQFLRFWSYDGSTEIFTKWVRGAPAQPFLVPAVETIRNKFNDRRYWLKLLMGGRRMLGAA